MSQQAEHVGVVLFFNTDICTTTGLTIYSGSLRMAFLMVSLPPSTVVVAF